jgi:hypothetical protein
VVASAERVLIEIEDECGGLPTDDTDELFRPFEQRGADRTGLGLGLPFSRLGVEASNGRLYARNLPDRGCVFTVESAACVISRRRLSRSNDVLEGTDSPGRRRHNDAWLQHDERRRRWQCWRSFSRALVERRRFLRQRTCRATFTFQVWGETEFTSRIGTYYDLRARLERQLPAVTVTDSVRQIRRGTHALARAIRVARPGAVQGEFFTVATVRSSSASSR